MDVQHLLNRDVSTLDRLLLQWFLEDLISQLLCRNVRCSNRPGSSSWLCSLCTGEFNKFMLNAAENFEMPVRFPKKVKHAVKWSRYFHFKCKMSSSFFKQSRGVGTQNGSSDTSTCDTFNPYFRPSTQTLKSTSDSVGVSEVPTPVSECPALVILWCILCVIALLRAY